MGVTRLQAGGTFDVNFGISYELPAVCDFEAQARAVTEDSAGRVLIAGACFSNTLQRTQYIVARFHGDDGTLDTTFGNAGFSIGAFDATSPYDEAFDIVIDASGRPVIAGDSAPSAAANAQSAMARLEYDLIFTNNYEVLPRGRLPGQ